MLKKCFNWMLMVSMVCCLSLGVTSCKDDDDNGNESKNVSADPLDNDEARTAWRWLCTLTNTESLDANWQSKTYEPTVGEPSANNEFTRIIVVDDLGDAKEHFASLADKETSELAGKVTIDGGAAGTMVWEPSKAGAENIAVVTVNSRIMPHLQKLVYCTEDQKGQNGSLFGNNMKGTPYYRFGDVIQDPDGYYWVCVRPCFAANEADKKLYSDTKGDSHWINIFNAAESGGKVEMPKANVKDTWNNLAKYNHQTIKLPTGLAYNREHLFNLAKLVFALINPDAYVQANEGVSDAALGNFPYKYNGKKFVQLVAQYWNEKGEGNTTIWQKLFNHTYEEMKNLVQMDLFYQGYSWKIGNSGYLWRFTSKKYEPYYYGSESEDKEEFEFVSKGFDVTYYAQSPNGVEVPWKKFTNEADGKHTGRWVVRYKKGEQLMTAGKFNYYSQITSKDGQQKDVYRYNAKRNIPAGENVKIETEDQIVDKSIQPKVGALLASNGKFYQLKSDATKEGATPVAIVLYVGNNGSVEQGANYKGLAIGIPQSTDNYVSQWGYSGNVGKCAVDSVKNENQLAGILNGIQSTQLLAAGCNAGHLHAAATFCSTYLPITSAVRQQCGLSQWFLPSVGQVQLVWNALKAYPMTNDYDTDKEKVTAVWAHIISQTELGNILFRYTGSIATSTAYDEKSGWFFMATSTDAFVPIKLMKNASSCEVHPFIAF